MIRMRHSALLSAIVIGALILAACARFVPGARVSPTPSVAAMSPIETPPAEGPLIVALDVIDGTRAWVMTDRNLLVTADGGQSWKIISAANVMGVRALVVLDAQHILLAAIDDLEVVVRTSVDSGQSWQESHLPTQGQPGDVRLAASDTMIAVLVQQTTSSNFSEADLFVSRDGGPYEKQPAPAAGTLTVIGTRDVWLAGGVFGNQLWRSVDAGLTWSEIRLPSQLGASIGIGVPEHIGDRLVLPVTINGPATQEAWLTSSDDGATWTELAIMAVGGETGQGVALPASRAGDQVVVAGPAGGLFAVTAAGQSLVPVSPNGLPTGVTMLRFTSVTAAWALVTERGCASGKSACFEVSRLFSTSNGGQTWNEVRLSG
jgi:photosystem II stability/assembly factor-like uncharacterized protein